MELCHYKFQTLFKTLISHITINSDIKILNKRYKLGMDIGATLQPVVVLSHHVHFERIFLRKQEDQLLKDTRWGSTQHTGHLISFILICAIATLRAKCITITNFHPFRYLRYSKFEVSPITQLLCILQLTLVLHSSGLSFCM